MLLQINAGQGPAECELAVGKFLRFLKKEYEIEIVEKRKGAYIDTLKTVVISGNEALSQWIGTVKWICQSPYRPRHKRKNWFIDSRIYDEAETITINENMVRFETFRSGGKGGQNVNKVETGVRAVSIPTGLSVVSTTARSQYRNKQIALEQLFEIITKKNNTLAAKQKQAQWFNQKDLERGNEIAVFEGLEFKRIK